MLSLNLWFLTFFKTAYTAHIFNHIELTADNNNVVGIHIFQSDKGSNELCNACRVTALVDALLKKGTLSLADQFVFFGFASGDFTH